MEKIDLNLIEKLAENMNTHSLNEISLENGEQKLVIKKRKEKQQNLQLYSLLCKEQRQNP